MEASWIREPAEPSRVSLENGSRPRLRDACPPGWAESSGGDGTLADADALCPTDEKADGKSRVARSPWADSREVERSGNASRRKSTRVVSSAGRRCSSYEKQIGGLQKLVLRAFCRELAAVDETVGLRRYSWAEPPETLTCKAVRARRTRQGRTVDTPRRVDCMLSMNSPENVEEGHGGRRFGAGRCTP